MMRMMMMMIVGVVVPLGSWRVGAALGIKWRLDGDGFGAETRQQRFDRGIAPHAQAIGKELHRHVTVAEMPGETRERGEVLGARLDQRLGLRDHLNKSAVL